MKHIKQLSLSLLTVLIMVGGYGGVAQAHVLKQNNTISGVLHLPPDDNPVAGQATTVYVSFSSRAGTFSLQNCDCQFAIAQNGATLQSAAPVPAFPGTTQHGSTTLTFPKTGVYDVIISGASKDGTFPTFKLDYIVRVERGTGAESIPVSAKRTASSTPLILGAGSFAVLAIIAHAAISNGQRYKPAVVPVKASKPPANKRKK